MNDKKRLFIFDLDGTLLDTLDDLCAGFNIALKSFGFKERTKEEFRNFVGNGVKKAIERAVIENVSDEEINNILNVFKKYYKNNFSVYTKPYPGIIDMLTKIKANGCKTAVLSNKFDEAVKLLCKKHFDGLIDFAAGECGEIKLKPSPEGIYKILKKYDCLKNESVYIGDSDTDILTAQNAGIDCISVLWGFRSKEFLLKSGAGLFAEKPDDILKIFNR